MQCERSDLRFETDLSGSTNDHPFVLENGVLVCGTPTRLISQLSPPANTHSEKHIGVLRRKCPFAFSKCFWRGFNARLRLMFQKTFIFSSESPESFFLFFSHTFFSKLKSICFSDFSELLNII